jgi:hypothetical protein
MQASKKFNLITAHVSTATANEHIQQFCKLTGHRVLVHHSKDGRILLRVGSDRWSSPSFGSASELIGFCAAINVGFTALELAGARMKGAAC